jgi:hypothetical protein
MTHGTILWNKGVVLFVGVASSHDDRGKMPLPQKNIQILWKRAGVGTPVP